MWHVGIDLHRETVVIAAVNDTGEVIKPVTVRCEDTASIVNVVQALGSFRAVIEASATYRWLYDLLRPYGTILLAHPFRLRAMVQQRTKTDKLDAQLLANLLRINQIPLAYIPPEPYQQLRESDTPPGTSGPRVGRGENPLAGLVGQAKSASPLSGSFRRPRLSLVSWARLRLDRESGPRRTTGAIETFRTASDDHRPAHRADVGGFSASGSLDRDSRHRPVLGVVDRGGNRRSGAFPHGKTGRRVRRADLPCASVGRTLLPRFDYTARVDVVAMDSRGGGHQGDPRGRGLEELLHAGAEAIQRKDCTGGGGPQTGGDMLEAAASLAA